MNRKFSMLFAAACAGALLTACAKDTDLSARYPDFMKYSFGDDCQFEYASTDETTKKDIYSLRFRDHSGTLQTISSPETSILPYADRSEKYQDMSEAAYYEPYLWGLLEDSTVNIFKAELTEQVMKPCLPDFTEIGSEDGKASLFVSVISLLQYSSEDAPDVQLIRERLTAGTGYQACRADLKSVACDEMFYVLVQCTVNEGEDAAPYISGMQAAYQKFLELTGAPLNYSFQVLQKEDSMRNTLFRVDCVLGEQIDLAQKRRENEKYSLVGDAKNRAFAKHGITVTE